MILDEQQKERIITTVEKELAKKQQIKLEKAHKLVFDSSLQQKIQDTPMFIAHCGVDQLVDLVIKDRGLIETSH